VNDEQDDADQEEDPRDLAGDRGNSSHAEKPGHQSNDEEYEREMQHDGSSLSVAL